MQKGEEYLARARDSRGEGLHGKTRFHLNCARRSAVKTTHGLRIAAAVPPKAPRGNKRRIPREYQRNTKRIRREYEENTKTTPGHPPSNPLACGLPRALCRLAPDCPLRINAAKATGIRAAPNHPQQSKHEARHYGPEPALRRLSRSAHPCAPFPVDRLRYLPQTSFRYEKKLGINSQFVPYYLLTGKTFLTNNSCATMET
jgi:hypothetical protein